MKRKVTDYCLVVLVLTICFGLIQAKKENKSPFNDSFFSSGLNSRSSVYYLYSDTNKSKNTDYSKRNMEIRNAKFNKYSMNFHSYCRQVDYLKSSSSSFYIENFSYFKFIK